MVAQTHLLVVDGGRTGCRARSRPPSGAAAESTGPPVPYVRGPHAALEIVSALQETFAGLPPGRPDVIVAGLAGIFEHREIAPELAEALAQRTGAYRVVVTGDLVTSHAGALGLAPGVVIAAGTGAVAFAVGTDGRTSRADGWGYLLGDEGGGYWIGRAGLAAALAHRDGRGGSAVLQARAQDRFGAVEGLPEIVHGTDAPAGLIAGFAPDVAAAAEEGDPVAAAIWADAASGLARSAAAAAGKVLGGQRAAASYTGGLFAAGALLLEPLRDELARVSPELVLRPPLGTALDGAELLAGLDPLPPELGYAHVVAP